jgi:hypothetical protein
VADASIYMPYSRRLVYGGHEVFVSFLVGGRLPGSRGELKRDQ